MAKHLGLQTAADLLQHFPRRYLNRGELTEISSLPLGETATVLAEVTQLKERRMRGRSGAILEVTITDGKSQLTLTFFNQLWRRESLKPGVRGLFAGKVGSFQGRLQLAHPDYELFEEELSGEEAKRWAEKPIPIYPAASSLPSWKIAKAVEILLDSVPLGEDDLPEELFDTGSRVSLAKALDRIHRPRAAADWAQARDYFRQREALLLQLSLLDRRARNESLQARTFRAEPGGLVAGFRAGLPYELTGSQRQAVAEIEADLAGGHPMNRLLQGEVGSGKTLVALLAMLTVAESGAQAALLAPTEVLARQHFESIGALLGEELSKRLGLTLLTGQQGADAKKKALLGIVAGRSLLVIGTHALLAERVDFFELGLVVIDEQHRFGVNQRAALQAKGEAPHLLSMTATPIPRTVAISVFGDLDFSSLTELPAGRSPIASHVVSLDEPRLVSRVWQRVAEEIASGRQAFVVCPRIEESDLEAETADENDFERALELAEEDLELPVAPARKSAAAVAVAEALAKNEQLAGVRLGLLHGRLDSETKNATMAAFAAGEVQLLVTTTVIEVGVNVPNATVMVVLDADRFGMAQLHQLRGRVGRGEHAGLCLLLTASPEGSLARERLTAVAETLDGFKLSELDLELRREGDVLGENQSGGRSSLRLLRVVRDAALIQAARERAEQFLKRNPGLEAYPALRSSLAAFGEDAAEAISKH